MGSGKLHRRVKVGFVVGLDGEGVEVFETMVGIVGTDATSSLCGE